MTGWINRRTIMFLLGAAGFIHELIRDGAERPFLLALSGALMGLPFVLAADGWKTKQNGSTMRQGKEDQQEAGEDRWSHLP